WVHQAFPQLGINGPSKADTDKKVQEHALHNTDTPSMEPMGNSDHSLSQSTPSSLETQLPPPGQTSLAQPDYSVQDSSVKFAQATLPLAQPASPRMAQLPVSIPVPNAGLAVPSVSSSGSLMMEQAQVRFPDDIPVAAQADGIITALKVDEGTMVKAGDIMIEIDSRLAKADEEVSRQELVAATLKAKDDSSIKFAEASVDVARQEVVISEDLVAQGVEGQPEYRKKRLELIKADLSVTVSKNDKKQQEAAVGVQTAKVSASKVHLDLRSIKAPWDGVVSEVAKRQFSFVRAGDTIFRLTSMEKIRIRGHVTVQDAPHLLNNAPARVTIDVAPGKSETMDSKVMFISPRTVINKNTYEILVEVSNRLTPDGQYLFREGMNATVEIMQKR
ncbi:MAG: HlyD family efflux transporter periplasmic adaptor subunit, partial [Pirellula sp.]